MVEKLIQ